MSGVPIVLDACRVCGRAVYHDELYVQFKAVVCHGKCVGLTAPDVERLLGEASATPEPPTRSEMMMAIYTAHAALQSYLAGHESPEEAVRDACAALEPMRSLPSHDQEQP